MCNYFNIFRNKSSIRFEYFFFLNLIIKSVYINYIVKLSYFTLQVKLIKPLKQYLISYIIDLQIPFFKFSIKLVFNIFQHNNLEK